MHAHIICVVSIHVQTHLLLLNEFLVPNQQVMHMYMALYGGGSQA